ncbi:hypothetical protein AB0425_41245 [Actinosynnema sp. NPDC051121]
MTRRAIAVLTIGAGALLVVLGSLFPLYGVETALRPSVGGGVPQPGMRRLVALTGWEYVQDPPVAGPGGGGFDYPVYGYGLVLAAVVAGVGAVVQLRSALVAAIGRFAVLAAFGVVVGTLWTALETLRTLFGNGTTTATLSTEEFVGAGTWLVGAAALALLVGAAVAHDWPARVPRPTGLSVYQVDDDDTPPFGIAIPVGELDVPPVAELPPVVELPGMPRPVDERRHPTGGNPSTVD